VGNGGDIDLIILMGGPHKVYLKALQEAYPDHEIIILDDAIRAVCEGMFFAGLQYQAAMAANAKKKAS
jgi:hypothetical protein